VGHKCDGLKNSVKMKMAGVIKQFQQLNSSFCVSQPDMMSSERCAHLGWQFGLVVTCWL